MYPKLSDLINAIFGTHINLPIMSYGFFVALAFLTGSWLLYLELKRKEKESLLKPTTKRITVGAPASVSDLLTNFVLAFILAFKVGGAVAHYDFFANDPQQFLFSWTGSWAWGIVFGVAYTFWFWYQKDKKKLKKPETKEISVPAYEQTWTIVLIAAVFGIIGAKIFNQFENWQEFISDPIGSLFSFSGLAFYGGLIVAGVAVIWYGHKHNIPWKPMADSFAPGLILAYGIGRIGCQVAGDGDWGIVNTLTKPRWLSFLPDWLWSYNYPHNIINEGIPIPGCVGEHCMVLPQGVFPTPIYETTMAVIIFIILWSIRKKIKIPGVLFSIYLIFNGVERFFIEHIRVNSKYDVFGLKFTQAELISLLLIITGIVGWIVLTKNSSQKKSA